MRIIDPVRAFSVTSDGIVVWESPGYWGRRQCRDRATLMEFVWHLLTTESRELGGPGSWAPVTRGWIGSDLLPVRVEKTPYGWNILTTDRKRFSGELDSGECLWFLCHLFYRREQAPFGGLQTYEQHVCGRPWMQPKQPLKLLTGPLCCEQCSAPGAEPCEVLDYQGGVV